MIKEFLKRNFLVSEYLKRKRMVDWVRAGYQIPVPHDVKQMSVLFYSTAYKLDTLVETGTYLGDMIWAQRHFFREIFSIELSPTLFQRAEIRFKYVPNVHLLKGDSSERIADVLAELKSPALFWLDGHYSGGITAKGEKVCPIYAELGHVLRSRLPHVVLIDDARLFTGKDDYPTIAELNSFVVENSEHSLHIENDIIVLRPAISN